MRFLPIIAASTLGMLAALGGYTFIYARGYSYVTNDPAACANCHIMEDHHRAWMKSSHRAVAVCNDCHTPPGLLPKYTTKAINGFNHSLAFTTGRFPEPLQITPRNADATEKACRKCAGARRIDRLRSTGATGAARRHCAGPPDRRGGETDSGPVAAEIAPTVESAHFRAERSTSRPQILTGVVTHSLKFAGGRGSSMGTLTAYLGSWTDSMSMGLAVTEGTYDAAAKKMTGSMEGPDMTGRVVKTRTVSEWRDAGTRVMTAFAPGPDGKEMQVMRITSTLRK